MVSSAAAGRPSDLPVSQQRTSVFLQRLFELGMAPSDFGQRGGGARVEDRRLLVPPGATRVCVRKVLLHISARLVNFRPLVDLYLQFLSMYVHSHLCISDEEVVYFLCTAIFLFVCLFPPHLLVSSAP